MVPELNVQIFLAFFCTVIVFYGWQSWRRNPLYSLKNTLMDAAVILLGLALVVGVSELIAFHLPSQSPAVIVLCCVAVIAAITLGLVAASFRITDGPIAKVPAGTTPENRNRHKLTPWILGTGLVLLLLLGWAALVSPEEAELPLVFAALVLMIGVASLGGLYIKARRFDYASAALKADFWVHWQDDIWLGPNGLLRGGKYTPWLTSGDYLTDARVETGPPLSLLLSFQKAFGARGDSVTTRVPIPEGRESDLILLAEKLRAQCPKARVYVR
jgi:NADH:ubiquinone oxidoreductase subunit K